MADEASRALAARLSRETRPGGVETHLIHRGRDGARVWLHRDEAGGQVIEKRVGRLAAARHAAGELFFHRHVSDALKGGLRAPRVFAAEATMGGARLLLGHVDRAHWNLFRQAGELASAVAIAEAEMVGRLAELAPRHAARLALMSPLRRPAWNRPRGGWPKRLGPVATLAGGQGLARDGAGRRWAKGLAALERRVARGAPTLANNDLIKPNLRFGPEGFTALDWGACAVMPRGHDLGVLIAALFRYDDRFVFRECEARAWTAAGLEGERAEAARFGFLVHALDHVCGPLFKELLAADPPLARDKLELLVERLEAVATLDSRGRPA